LEPRFIYYVFQSLVWQKQLAAVMQQTTRNQVSIQKQAYFRIPVPPLAEQQRIVAKVDELMRWCDALEARLTAAQTTATHLLDATLRQLLLKP
jgi:type I restriction enzyme S subunit